MKLLIERVHNGYLITADLNTEDERRIVLEENTDDELKAHEQLLYEIMDFFGFVGSKHDKERIRINREKQEYDV